MTPIQFLAWRKRCGLRSWKAVAQALDMGSRQVERYAAGEQPIPRTVALACEALEWRHAEQMRARGARKFRAADEIAVPD